jgi:hypothetical protein
MHKSLSFEPVTGELVSPTLLPTLISEEYINRCFGELAIELKTKPTPWLLLLLLQPFFPLNWRNFAKKRN